MMFLGLRKLGNICCGHVSEQNQKHFLSRTQNLCPQQMLRARTNGETFVSATMCPRLPEPYSNLYFLKLLKAVLLSKFGFLILFHRQLFIRVVIIKILLPEN